MKIPEICKEILETCQNDTKEYKAYLSGLFKYTHSLREFSLENEIGEEDVIAMIETQFALFELYTSYTC